MKRPTLRTLGGAAALALLLGGAASASAAATASDGDLARDFQAVDRNTDWSQVEKVKLNFSTYHPEGLAITPDHLFLSSTQVTEPTQKYPTPVGGYDRTPGKGVGHLFVMDRQGHLQKDITFVDGDMYHPGGIDFDGTNIWVPVAQYRPNSSAIIYRVNARTLQVTKAFEVKDHIGGIVRDRTTGHLVGNNWGSRRFYDWTLQGKQIRTWDNSSFFTDYQDCQYVPSAKMICGGITNLPQTPTAGGASATYELGGLTMIDLRSHNILREVPFQKWSTAGHVMTRNPVKMAATGNQLTLWAAPDNGDEGNGTELFTYHANVDR
ncbi:DUF6454 family protein [Oryzihumus sp.]|uniref:DUF6454 family protein n=1 Tax=Oryzihumus sp. TaxID=1968903 RepID=UPI002ED79177